MLRIHTWHAAPPRALLPSCSARTQLTVPDGAAGVDDLVDLVDEHDALLLSDTHLPARVCVRVHARQLHVWEAVGAPRGSQLLAQPPA
jgi:hypothetical protein